MKFSGMNWEESQPRFIKATPKFHKARSVPFALHQNVEEDLEHLRIIEPVQFSMEAYLWGLQSYSQ